MSTYIYLLCRDHNPAIQADGESGQHLTDLPQLRQDIANRDACEHRCAHVEACPMCKPCDDALTRDLMEGL